MRFFMFHLMPWDGLPPSYEGPAWVTCPNSHYDPVHGGELYNRYIDEQVRAGSLEVIDACGHLPPVERPVEFADAVLRFLA